MERRYFVKGLWAGVASLSFLPSTSQAKSCKIIGIGGAGCNFVLAAGRSGTALVSAKWRPQFICIDLDLHKLSEVDAVNAAMAGFSSIKTVSLGQLGSGGNVSIARAIALRQRDALKALMVGAERVFLVAGLRGGTGSGVAPFIARLARDAGAFTVATVITPFEFEGEAGNQNADYAICHLNREADRVLRFSNQELMETLGDDVTLGILRSAMHFNSTNPSARPLARSETP